MKKKSALVFLALFISKIMMGGYVPLTISSGLNEDVIANGVGSASTSTSNDVDGVNYCFVAPDFQATSTSILPTYALPSTGLINSAVASTTGLTYQLASYSANNSLRIGVNNVTHAVTFSTQDAATDVYLLATSGSGDCYMDVTINFTGGTSETFTNLLIEDWYDGAGYAIQGIGRVNSTTNALEGTSLNPRLYQIALSITAVNQTKLITGIEITKSSGTGILNLLAVSINETAATCAAPGNLIADNIGLTTADLNWTENGSATQWQVEYGSGGYTLGSGTSAYTTSNPYSLTTLSSNTPYDFYVRSVCGPGDTSAWVGPYSFTTSCAAPALLSFTDGSLCGPGSVTLNATADAGAVLNWYDVPSGGTVLGTGNVFATPALTATATYYVAAASSGGSCEGPRQAVTATIYDNPIVDLGPDTPICPGIAQSLDAGNPGSDYLWSTSATAQSINATTPGTYSVVVTDGNNCSGRDTIILTPGIQPVNNLPAITDLCMGTTIALDAGNPGCTYDWNTTETTQSINVNTPGSYTVGITSIDYCFLESNTNVVARMLPVVDLGNDTAICPNDVLVLDAGNPGDNYLWNTGDLTQTINSSDSGTYSVLVTDSYGCSAEDARHIAFLSQPYVEGFNFIPMFYEALGTISFTMLNPRDVISCSWDFGDGSPVSTDPAPTHIYASGDYLVQLTVFNGCGTYTTSLMIHVNTVTGIVESSGNGRSMLLYPNPARNQIMIENKTGLPVEQMAVFDISGKMIFQTGSIPDKYLFDISACSPGLYSVRFLTRNGWEVARFEVLR